MVGQVDKGWWMVNGGRMVDDGWWLYGGWIDGWLMMNGWMDARMDGCMGG